MEDIIRIDENSWRIEDGHVRFLLFCGAERAALIDTGMNRPDARQIAESLTDLPIILINTHADRDHISGNCGFDEFYMSPAEEEHYRSQGGKGKLNPIREGDVIDLGGRPLRIIDIPGHTQGSIAILDEKNRVLVSGDSVQDGNIFMFGAHRDMDLYIAGLEHLALYDGLYDEIYPMHGTFPVKPDLTRKLIAGAKEIMDGLATGTRVDMFGKPVCLYKFPYAGFLCELPEVKEYKHTVRYYETDRMGITHHSNYIRWMEEARLDYMKQLGWGYEKMEKEGIISPVTEVECKYKLSTTFPDDVYIAVSVAEMRGVKLKLKYMMKNADGKVVCEAASVHCFLGKDGRILQLKKEYPEFHQMLVDRMEG